MTKEQLTAIENHLLSSPRFMAAMGRPVPVPEMGTWQTEDGSWSWREGTAEGTGYETRSKAELGLVHFRRGRTAETEIQQLRTAFPQYVWQGLSVVAHGVVLYQGDAVRVELLGELWVSSVGRVKIGEWQTLLLAALEADNYSRGTVLR